LGGSDVPFNVEKGVTFVATNERKESGVRRRARGNLSDVG
jgi:hypothetical protein